MPSSVWVGCRLVGLAGRCRVGEMAQVICRKATGQLREELALSIPGKVAGAVFHAAYALAKGSGMSAKQAIAAAMKSNPLSGTISSAEKQRIEEQLETLLKNDRKAAAAAAEAAAIHALKGDFAIIHQDMPYWLVSQGNEVDLQPVRSGEDAPLWTAKPRGDNHYTLHPKGVTGALAMTPQDGRRYGLAIVDPGSVTDGKYWEVTRSNGAMLLRSDYSALLTVQGFTPCGYAEGGEPAPPKAHWQLQKA